MATRELPNEVLKSTPLVSVMVTTYQHAPFIEACLKGILEQRTDFAVELLLGEDESTDGTREICERIAAAQTDRIRLFLRSRKDVIKVFGKPTGRANFLHLMSMARGKYVAFCEGDDHWIDPFKLQRQVDAMERDPEATGCFTNAYNEKDGARTEFLGVYNKYPDGPIVREREHLHGQGFPTCTFLYRRDQAKGFEDIHMRFGGGDTPLFTLLLGRGHFIFQPEFTGVRAIHPGGIYSMQGAVHHLRVQLVNIHEQDKLSNYRHHDVIQLRKEYALKKGWREAMEKENWELARLVWKYAVRDRALLGWSLSYTVLAGLRIHVPKGYSRTVGVLGRIRRQFAGPR